MIDLLILQFLLGSIFEGNKAFMIKTPLSPSSLVNITVLKLQIKVRILLLNSQKQQTDIGIGQIYLELDFMIKLSKM